jgi:hypothetical protein
MTPPTSTGSTLSTSLAEQITDLLTVCDTLLRTGTDQVRAELARCLHSRDNQPGDLALFIDLLGLTAGHLTGLLQHTRPDPGTPHSGGPDE